MRVYVIYPPLLYICNWALIFFYSLIFVHFFDSIHLYSLYFFFKYTQYLLVFQVHFIHHVASCHALHTQPRWSTASCRVGRSMSCSCILPQFLSSPPSDWPICQHGARCRILAFTCARPRDVMATSGFEDHVLKYTTYTLLVRFHA